MNSPLSPAVAPPVTASATPSLDQLRDIHLPPSISWWPPAPGWWFVAAAALLLGAGLAWQFGRYRKNRWRRQALQELTHLREMHASRQVAPHVSVKALSILLRRVAVNRFPRKDVAALNGDAWLIFLDRALGRRMRGAGQGFMSDQGRLLAVAPYVPDAEIDAETLNSLFDLSEHWFKKLPAGGKK